MGIELIIDLSRIASFYGSIPETAGAPVGSYERYQLDFDSFDYFDIIDEDFIQPVDNICHSLLDIGDVEYLDIGQCKLLVPWLEKRLERPCPHPLDAFYPKLLEFARRAIELGTGVVIDL